MEETKSILRVTPSTNARNVVVISAIRNARIMAINRGLRDILNELVAFGRQLLASFCCLFYRSQSYKANFK